MKTLTLIVPIYNGESVIWGSVLYYFNYLKKLKELERFEILICVNGSSDNTEKISRQLEKKYKEINVLVTKKRGMGSAIHLGITNARNGLITYMPGDGEINANFIENAIPLMENNDFVMGSRKLGGGYSGKNLQRKIFSKIFTFLVSIFFSQQLSEAGNVRMFRKKWARKFVRLSKEEGFAWQIENIYFAKLDRLKIANAPVFMKKIDEHSKSSVKLIRDSLKLFIAILSYGFRYIFQLIKRKIPI